jgi:nicotinamidase-related amidase
MPIESDNQDRYSVVITDSVTNDFVAPGFEGTSVHIGAAESRRLIGYGEELGALPLLLSEAMEAQKAGKKVAVINVRDLHDKTDPRQVPELLRYGDHNLIGTEGAEVINPIKDIYRKGRVENVDVTSLSIPIKALRDAIHKATGIDILTDHELLDRLIITLTGTHTNIRIFDTADTLVHKLGMRPENVIVCPHLTASANQDAHRQAITDWLPSKLITVAQSVAEVCGRMGITMPPPELVKWVESCTLEPEDVKEQLNPDQVAILETFFMHKDRVKIKILGGGYSGSILIMATAHKGNAEEKPVVIKMDKHVRIKREVDGYHKVKELLAMNVPAFSSPVSRGSYTGIKIDLAAIKGNPKTLQSIFEADDAELGSHTQEALGVLESDLYRNTRRDARFNPLKQHGLNDPQQAGWLEENMGHIMADNENSEGANLGGMDISGLPQAFRKLSQRGMEVDGDFCTAHGDLNFANIIFDNNKNVWFIDWTHTGDNALETDFAKMESDIKFVMTKGFTEEDIPNLAKFEQFILSMIELPALEDLTGDLEFVKTDRRFGKVYGSIKNIRNTYSNLKVNKGSEDIAYRTALLKYSVHTLSFDKRRGRGECELPALKYALMSTNILVNQLNELADATK